MCAGVLLKRAAEVEEADTLMIHATSSMAHPVVDSAKGKKGTRRFARPRIGHKKTSLNLKLCIMAASPDAWVIFPVRAREIPCSGFDEPPA